MYKINLEKELTKGNVTRVSARELLILKEYDKITSIPDSAEVLKRAGLDSNLKEGEEVTSRLEWNLKTISKFNQEKVFHIDQIEAVANKYYLRFLRSFLYKGDIDTELPSKISQFEIAYEIKNSNYFILAPKESFKLQERPKDPLFFYQINDEYYYLIHKWGNDLSVTRRLLSCLTNPLWVVALWVLLSLILEYFAYPSVRGDVAGKPVILFIFMATVCGVLGLLTNLILLASSGFSSNFLHRLRFVPKNNWNSEYND